MKMDGEFYEDESLVELLVAWDAAPSGQADFAGSAGAGQGAGPKTSSTTKIISTIIFGPTSTAAMTRVAVAFNRPQIRNTWYPVRQA